MRRTRCSQQSGAVRGQTASRWEPRVGPRRRCRSACVWHGCCQGRGAPCRSHGPSVDGGVPQPFTNATTQQAEGRVRLDRGALQSLWARTSEAAACTAAVATSFSQCFTSTQIAWMMPAAGAGGRQAGQVCCCCCRSALAPPRPLLQLCAGAAPYLGSCKVSRVDRGGGRQVERRHGHQFKRQAAAFGRTSRAGSAGC